MKFICYILCSYLLIDVFTWLTWPALYYVLRFKRIE